MLTIVRYLLGIYLLGVIVSAGLIKWARVYKQVQLQTRHTDKKALMRALLCVMLALTSWVFVASAARNYMERGR